MILLAASSVYAQSDDSLSLFNHSSSSRVFVAGFANGIDLDWNRRGARAENVEFQMLPQLWAEHKTVLQLLSYLNHANMGDYREATDAFIQGYDPEPNIEAHREQGRRKFGFGLNGEQQVTGTLRVFVPGRVE
jgi:high affinity Mn2+ porin